MQVEPNIQWVSAWVRLGVLLLTKNNTSSIVTQRNEAIQECIMSLRYANSTRTDNVPETYYEIEKEFITFILGMCKGDFDMIKVIANRCGCFDHEKVKGLFNILGQFQDTIFQNDIHGLPDLSSGLKDAYASANKYGSTAMGAMKNGSKAVGNEIKQQLQAVSQEAMQIGGTYITELLYKDLFKMFDKDDSGYISYSEFCDLCKYMGLYMNEEKSLKMFALADTNQNNFIEI